MSKKRRREAEAPELTEAEFDELAAPYLAKTKKRGKRKSSKRAPSLKRRLTAKLRAKKKLYRAKLKSIERDLNSLICKRRKA